MRLLSETPLADEGCSLHPACLTCPFERCRYDGLAEVQQQQAMDARASAIRRLRADGLTIAEIAGQLGISRRTAQRALSGKK